MSKWKKRTLRLPANHGWKARPGYNVIVADRGAVRFDFPREWVVIPESDSIKFYNCRPPDDDCRLQLTVIHTPPGIDWRDLPLTMLLVDVTKDNDGDVISRGAVTHVQRAGVELAWLETRFLDPNEHREARSRTCLARGSAVHCVLTLDFWPEDEPRFGPVWDEVLRSMRLGQHIADPRRGPDR